MNAILRTGIAVAFLMASFAFSAPMAFAEAFISAYGGYAVSVDEERDPVEGGDFTVTLGDTSPGKTPAFGGRAGYWFEALPWLGVELDVGYMTPDLELSNGRTRVDVDVVSLGFSVLARYLGLLPTTDFPRGTLQPYAGVGPALFAVRTEESQASATSGGTFKVTNTTVQGGVQAEAGAKWFFMKLGMGSLALFGEYRFSWFKLTAPTPLATTVGTTTLDQVGTYTQQYLINAFIGGIAWHF